MKPALAWSRHVAMSPTEYQELVTFIGRRFDTIVARRDALDRDLTELRRSVGDLESRVDQIRRRLPS